MTVKSPEVAGLHILPQTRGKNKHPVEATVASCVLQYVPSAEHPMRGRYSFCHFGKSGLRLLLKSLNNFYRRANARQ